jgi:hypothetical protein
MIINYQYLHSVFFIFRTRQDAEDGASGGATGHFVAREVDAKKVSQLYAITNAHNIEEATEEGLDSVFVRVSTVKPGFTIIEVPLSDWVKHPKAEDLAGTFLDISPDMRFTYLTPKRFAKPDMIAQDSDLGIGTETLTIGRESGLTGSIINLPLARFGHIAMLPIEAIEQPSRAHHQMSFIIESHSISGYSGSPIYAQIEYEGKQRPVLVGTHWGHRDLHGKIVHEKIETTSPQFKLATSISLAVPAWMIPDLMDEMDKSRR